MSTLVVRRLPIVLLLASLVSGCASIALLARRDREPTIQLAASKVTELSLTEADLSFEIAVSNPNGFGLPVRGVDYRLRVEDTVVARGHQWIGIFVTPATTHTATITMTSRLDVLIEASPYGMTLGEVPYTLELDVSYGTWFVQRTFEWQAQSAVSLNLPLGLARIDSSSEAHL